MGTVWEARHLSLGTQIAIKFLNAELSRRRDLLGRFASEATSAARIRSPHVVGILDYGFTDEGHAFIAMELLQGEDLGRRLTRFGKLTVNETALLVTQVCRGLTKAHSANVVHRDLKPENIFIVDEDDAFTVKILDFGIAKFIGTEAATHKTETGQILGTPLYMSPEQALGRPVDSRSDLYSLAVVAYRCLTGRLPFVFPAAGEMIVAVSTHDPPPPSQFNPNLPATLDNWFAGALAKDPAGRLAQRSSEFAEMFNRACGDALDGLWLPEDHPRSTPQRQSRPPASSASEPPVPSEEEVAPTVAAAQFHVGPPSRPSPRMLLRRWWPLIALAAFGIATGAALTLLEQHSAGAGPKLVAQLNQSQGKPSPPLASVESPAAPSPGPPTTDAPSATQHEAVIPISNKVWLPLPANGSREDHRVDAATATDAEAHRVSKSETGMAPDQGVVDQGHSGNAPPISKSKPASTGLLIDRTPL